MLLTKFGKTQKKSAHSIRLLKSYSENKILGGLVGLKLRLLLPTVLGGGGGESSDLIQPGRITYVSKIPRIFIDCGRELSMSSCHEEEHLAVESVESISPSCRL